MKEKNETKTIILFIALIIGILILFIYNLIINKPLKNVDRKVEKIFGYSYSSVQSASEKLFLNAINLINGNYFEYEKNNDSNKSDKLYSLNNKNVYKKITNFTLVNNTFAFDEISKFMEYKNIIETNGNYFIKLNDEKNIPNYTGSTIKINSYDDKYAYLESTNYYCNDKNNIEIIKEELKNCTITKTNFTIINSNGVIKINNINDFIKERIY